MHVPNRPRNIFPFSLGLSFALNMNIYEHLSYSYSAIFNISYFNTAIMFSTYSASLKERMHGDVL